VLEVPEEGADADGAGVPELGVAEPALGVDGVTSWFRDDAAQPSSVKTRRARACLEAATVHPLPNIRTAEVFFTFVD
jgi:hypothetical protein